MRSVGKIAIAAVCLAAIATVRESRAALIDLASAASGSFTMGTDLFTRTEQASTGTGVIQSFVRIQANTSEEGYNTDARPLQFNENSSPSFTRALLLSDVPIKTIDGVQYREFLLDVNQQSSDPLITMKELQIFVGNTGSPSGATVGGGGVLNFGAQATLVYDMDASGSNSVTIDYNLNPGSGGGDMFAYIKSSLFVGGTYVTLYSKFGAVGGVGDTNDGFEEWAVEKAGPPTTTTLVPEPASMAAWMIGLACCGAAGIRRRRLALAKK